MKIGIVTDIQFSSYSSQRGRDYAQSLENTKKILTIFRGLGIETILNLGDLIDGDERSLDEVLPLFEGFKCHHVLGNHDFLVPDASKNAVMKQLGFSSAIGYRHFNLAGWTILVLDGTEISHFRYSRQDARFKETQKLISYYYPDMPYYGGAISQEQILWLNDVLKTLDRPTIILCHYPIFPKGIHSLENAYEVCSVLSQSEKICAVFSGHEHCGKYRLERRVHHITFSSILEQNSYAVLELNDQIGNIQIFNGVIENLNLLERA